MIIHNRFNRTRRKRPSMNLISMGLISRHFLIILLLISTYCSARETHSQIGAFTTISTSTTKFNFDEKLNIFAYIQASSSVTASWTADIGGKTQHFTSLTPSKLTIPETDVTSLFSFPLTIPPYSFQPGSVVNFLLSVNGVGNKQNHVRAFSEISMFVNGPPSGGSLSVDPWVGSALSTLFEFNLLDWSDDSTDLPLTYSFSYLPVEGQPAIPLNERSLFDNITVELPEGLQQNNYLIAIVGRVFDNAMAGANVSSYVTVEPLRGVADVHKFVGERLRRAVSAQDTNAALHVINAAANSLNIRNCSLVSNDYCASLNREPCGPVNQLCGRCKSGFFGVNSKHSNSKCFLSTFKGLEVLEEVTCKSDADCGLGECVLSGRRKTEGFCKHRAKACLSVNNDTCSGHGSCTVVHDFNTTTEVCSQSSAHCKALCQCDEGYGGADCSLTIEEVQQRSDLRVSLCKGILKLVKSSNPSLHLIEQAIGALELSYQSEEVTSVEGSIVCREALWMVSQLASQNTQLRSGISLDSSLKMLHTVSRFVPQSNSIEDSEYSDELELGLQSGDILNEIVSNVASVVLKSMTNGHEEVHLVSEGIAMTVFKTAVFQMESRTLSPPPSDLEVLLNSSLPSITFTSTAVDECNAGDGYVQMSVASWTSSPYKNSSNVMTSLFRSESYFSSRELMNRRSVQYTGEGSEILEDIPDYFITLQFKETQNFSFSFDLDDDGFPINYNNETFPVCHYYVEDKYVPCNNCNISSYNNYNVTYACKDISFFCGVSDVNSRIEYDINQMSQPEVYYGRELADSNRTYYYSGTQGSYYASDGGGVTLSQLATIMYDIRISFAKILSTFRFRMINFRVDAPMLTFVFGLAMGIVCGFVLFFRWDRFDHDELVYANVSARNRRAARKKRSEAYVMQNDELKHDKVIRRRWFRQQNFTRLLEKRKKRAVDTGEEEEVHEIDTADLGRRVQHEYFNILANLSIDLDPDPYVEAFESDPVETFIDAAVPAHEEFDVLDQRHADEEKRKAEEEAAMANGGGGEVTLSSLGAAFGVDLTVEKSAALALTAVTTSVTFFSVVLARHDYFAIFNRSTGSLGQTRMLRFSQLTLKVLLCLMLDTLFFSVFFPDTGLCESYRTKADCLEKFNLASNSNLCMWTKPLKGSHAGSCALAPPPQNVFFTLTVVLITVICAAPVNITFNNLRSRICSKRPDIEALKLDPNFWLNSSSQVIHEVTVSLLEFNAKQHEKPVNLEALEEERMSHPGVTLRTSKPKINTNTNKKEATQDEMEFIGRRCYENMQSVQSEAEQLHTSIVEYGRSRSNHAELIWGKSLDDAKRKEARIRAMDRELRVNLHGAYLPLTLRQYLCYGTTKRRIVAKLRKARRDAKEISEQMENIDEFDYNDRDTLLLQRFVLEQFSATKRYCLRRQLFNFRSSTPFKINPLIWALGWGIMFLLMLFFMYWILAWGVLSGKKTFTSWGWNFGLQFAQDVLVTEVLKIYTLYVISVFSMKPQLNNIYRKLNLLAIAEAQGESLDGMNEIRVVQYLSPACRVSRIGHAIELHSAKMLRRMDDIDQEDCQKDSHIRMNIFGYMFFGVASVIALYSDFWSDFVMEVTIPCVSIGFVLASYYLYKATITTFAMFFFFVVCCFLSKRYYDNLKAKDLMRRKAGVHNNVNIDPSYLIHKTRKKRKMNFRLRYSDVEAVLVKWFDFIRWVYKLRHFRFDEHQVKEQHRLEVQWRNINSIYSQTDDMDNLPFSHLGHSAHVPQEVLRMKAADIKTVHTREAHHRPDVITQLLSEHLLNCDPYNDEPDAESVESYWESSSESSKSNAPSTPTMRTRSRSASSHRSRVESVMLPAFDIEKLAVFADDNNTRWPLIRPMMFRFRHTKTRNPLNALVRMFHKYLGKIQQIHDVFDHSDAKEIQRYFQQITQYQNYDDTCVSTEAFTLIIKEIFTIYQPINRKFTKQEMQEILEMYYAWLLENPFPDDATPCAEFIKWFLALKDIIIKSNDPQSTYDVDEVVLYGASRNWNRRRRVIIEYSDGSVSSTSESYINTSDGETFSSSQSSVSSYSTQSPAEGYSEHSSDYSSDSYDEDNVKVRTNKPLVNVAVNAKASRKRTSSGSYSSSSRSSYTGDSEGEGEESSAGDGYESHSSDYS